MHKYQGTVARCLHFLKKSQDFQMDFHLLQGAFPVSPVLSHTQQVLGESHWCPHIVKVHPANCGFNQMHGFIAWA